MRHSIASLVVALVALALGARASGADPRVAAIAKQDAAARQKCAGDLVKLARDLAGMKAVDEAREELRRAMAIAPADSACRKEFAKLSGDAGATPDAAEEKCKAGTLGS